MERIISKNRFALKKDFAPILGIVLVTFFVVASYSSPVWAKHHVLGKITFSDHKPASGVLVVAKDSDGMGDLDKDDKMGQAITDAQGHYNIDFTGKSWDTKIPGSDSWRPDIFIVVFRNVGGQWARVAKSNVHKDWKMRNDLTINLTIPADRWSQRPTRFQPKAHGWNFQNTKFINTCVKVSGKEVCGPLSLCGGMSLSALRRFKMNIPVEPFSDKVHHELEKAQGETMSAGMMLKFAEWSVIPSKPGMLKLHTIGYRTEQEWPHVRRDIDGGNPLVIGLVRVNDDDVKRNGKAVFDNHQVLAIGYNFNDATGESHIYAYDPNNPGQVSDISFCTTLPNSQINIKQFNPGRGWERVRGFFIINVH